MPLDVPQFWCDVALTIMFTLANTNIVISNIDGMVNDMTFMEEEI